MEVIITPTIILGLFFCFDINFRNILYIIEREKSVFEFDGIYNKDRFRTGHNDEELEAIQRQGAGWRKSLMKIVFGMIF